MHKPIPAREWRVHGMLDDNGLWTFHIACPTKARRQGVPMIGFKIDEEETPITLACKIENALNQFEIGLAARPGLVAVDGRTPLDETPKGAA